MRGREREGEEGRVRESEGEREVDKVSSFYEDKI